MTEIISNEIFEDQRTELDFDWSMKKPEAKMLQAEDEKTRCLFHELLLELMRIVYVILIRITVMFSVSFFLAQLQAHARRASNKSD